MLLSRGILGSGAKGETLRRVCGRCKRGVLGEAGLGIGILWRSCVVRSPAEELGPVLSGLLDAAPVSKVQGTDTIRP